MAIGTGRIDLQIKYTFKKVNNFIKIYDTLKKCDQLTNFGNTVIVQDLNTRKIGL